MAVIRISKPTVVRQGDEVIVSARVDARSLGSAGEDLWFRMPAGLAPEEPRFDPFAIALLLPAMVAGDDLVVDGPLSPSLARNLAHLQRHLVAENPMNRWTRFRPVEIHATYFEEAVASGKTAAGLFFSGGVDSMYSLVYGEAETGRSLDTVVFVHGFDVPLERVSRLQTVLHHVTAAAELTGRRVVLVATNLRRFTDAALHWEMAHGAGLAAVGHLLGAHFDCWFISASDSHVRNGELSGTTTPVDRLWSREGLRFISVGGHIDRQAKVDLMTEEPCMHRHLVVCWKAADGIANCGRCAKCLRTMLNLLVADSLHRSETLPHDVRPELLSADAMPPEPARIIHWEAMRDRLESRAEWAPLVPPIEALIERSRRFKRGPRPEDLRTSEGRKMTVEWLRRKVRRRMPISMRRRILPAYRSWQNRGAKF